MSTSPVRAIDIIIIMCVLVSVGGASSGGRFRGSNTESSNRTITVQEVQSTLQETVEAMLQRGHKSISRKLAKIEASMWQTFQALPKNSFGRLAPRVVRYMVHNYFAKEHGWLIQGLEPHGMHSNATEVHDVSILQDKAPTLVAALLESRQSDRGLSLGDTVVMIATLERLIVEESVEMLRTSYSLNNQSAADEVDARSLHAVLISYLLVFEKGVDRSLSDVSKHHAMKKHLVESPGWKVMLDFEHDTVHNFDFAHRHTMNPFTQQMYSFDEASHIVDDLAHGYGRHQNAECINMKEELMSLSRDGSGRVPLSAFYSQPDTSDYHFVESADYLRQIGALDESVPQAPQVRIANYLTGPSNCIAVSTYFSVCCLSECESLLNELEHQVQAPDAPLEQLLGSVRNLSSSSVDAPRKLPEILSEKLRSVADRHGGTVPLHGRLFAQWLHFAFPNECPYPHIPEDKAALTPRHWKGREQMIASEEDKERHMSASHILESVTEPSVLQWSDDEVLPLYEPQTRSTVGSGLRFVVHGALLFVVVRIAFVGHRAVDSAWSGKGEKTKSAFVLPIRV